MEKLKEFAKVNNIDIKSRDFSLPEIVQETYRLNYRLKESTNEELKSLAESHLKFLRENPTQVDQLKENLNILLGLETLGDEAILTESDGNDPIVVNKWRRRIRPKDLDKSRAMKKAWAKNRRKMTKALAKFRKSARGKAFYRSLGKFNAKMHENEEFTLMESIALFKAGNSALTHLAVELEHNPEFKDTFNEAASILAEDLGMLLESIMEGRSPESSLLESFQEFHSILAEDDETEEVQ